MTPYFRLSYVSVFGIALILSSGCLQDRGEDAEYFFCMDDNIVSSNHLLQQSNWVKFKKIENYAGGNRYYAYILPFAKEIGQITAHFNEYIEYLRGGLIIASGGLYPNDFTDKSLAGRPVRYNDKGISYTYFSKGDKPKGTELYKELAEARLKLNNLIDSLVRIPKEVAYIKQEEINLLKNNLARNADQYLFFNTENGKDRNQVFKTSVSKAFPMLSMLQSEAIRWETTILDFLDGKLSGPDITWGHPPIPVSIPEKSFVYMGEKFSTDICFFSEGIYPPNLDKISVDGISVPIIQGRGHYETIARRKGENSYKVEIWVEDIFDNKLNRYSKIFKYEVGNKCD